MSYFNDKRKKIAGMLTILLIAITLFLIVASDNMIEMSELVERARRRKAESVGDFLQLSIKIIEDDWERYQGGCVEGFIDYSLKSNTTLIHRECQNKPFGSCERFYYTTTRLGDDLVVLVRFKEQFLSSLDIDIVQEIESNSVKLLYQIFALLLFVFVFGAVIIWEIIKLGKEFTFDEICKEV